MSLILDALRRKRQYKPTSKESWMQKLRRKWKWRQMMKAMREQARAEAYAIKQRAKAEAEEKKILAKPQFHLVRQRAKRMKRRLRKETWRIRRRALARMAGSAIRVIRQGAVTSLSQCRRLLIWPFRQIGRISIRAMRRLGGIARAVRHAVSHGISTGVRAIRRAGRAAGHGMIAAVKGVRRGLVWPFRRIANGLAGAGRRTAAFLRRADTTMIGLLLMVLFTALAIVGVALNNNWIWTICLWGAVLANGLRFYRRLVMRRATIVYVGGWLIALTAHWLSY